MSDTFTCEDCGKQFDNANSLAGHQRNPGKAHAAPEPVEAPVAPKTELTPDEALEEARRVRAAQNAAREADTAGDLTAPRTRGQRRGTRNAAQPSDIPWPELDLDFIAPAAYVAVIDKIAEFSDDVVFHIDPEKMSGLPFTQPGGAIPNKPLYTVKGLMPDGRLIQLPFEEQVNNQVAADPLDAIGLRRYLRKGIKLFIDMDTLQPLYCAAFDCWAPAITNENVADFPMFRGARGTGFCSIPHASATLPNMFDDEGGIRQGLLSAGVTTSRVWAAGNAS